VLVPGGGYGKAAIRLLRLDRESRPHRLQDLTLAIRLEGEFDAAYTAGDNRDVLPTDTMKNTVYALAGERPFEPIEELGLAVAGRLLAAAPAARRARIEIVEQPWAPLGRGPDVFGRPGPERRLATVERAADRVAVAAGIAGLALLRTSGSAFAGFLRDRYTTLEESGDRLLATTVAADWDYLGSALGERRDYDASWEGVRRTLVDAFAARPSRSVQQTLYVLGEAVLAAHPEVGEVRLRLPNHHHHLVDLSPFGLDNRHRVFQPAAAPYGVIEGTVRREE
jgi:urate oxidase